MTTSLLELAQAVKDGTISIARKVVLFGPPGSGKTQIAATIARVSSIKKVHWFDLENGIETLVFAKDSKGEPLLTPEEMAKIQAYRISDTKESPRAAETLLKLFTAQNGIELCQTHGKVGCTQCAKVKLNAFTMKEDEVIVIDSGSQLADSVLHISQLANNYKDLRQHYGDFTNDMGAIVSGIQATHAHVIMCTHEYTRMKTVAVGNNKTEDRPVRIVPLVGSSNFSDKVGKYFGYKIYTYTNGSTYRATCKLNKIDKVLVSARRPVSFEGLTDPSLELLFASEEEVEKQAAEAKASGPAINVATKLKVK